ncbi:RrF2 family transcriptional regulator [candidate division KSB1 bacterium]
MLKLTKRSEYGIMAMKYIAMQSNGNGNIVKTCSARSIADYFNIPPEIMAKILQKLVRRGLIISQKGKNGGYNLSKKPHDISVGDIIMALEDCMNIVDCSTEKGLNCDQLGVCAIENPMKRIQKDLNNYFNNITLTDLVKTED